MKRGLKRGSMLRHRGLEMLETKELLAADFHLQILHASDLEGGVDAISRAPNFAAVVEGLEQDAEARGIPSITLSAGDNYIPGPFFSAAADSSVRPALRMALENPSAREGVGRADIGIMNIIGFDASALGNHEFDPTTSTLGTIIGTDIRDGNGDGQLDDPRWLGAQFPYLSANLDFSNDRSVSFLVASDDSILPNTAFLSPADDLSAARSAPKLAPATLVAAGDEWIGVVGATTPLLAQISSPGDTSVIGSGRNDMEELAAILQPVIDRLINEAGVNKVVLVSHLQQLALEQELVGLLSGVDVVIAGGSDSILADETDRLDATDSAAGNYPLLTSNADGDPAYIVSTDGQYTYVGRLLVGFDAAGVIDVDSLDPTLNGPYITDDSGVTDVWSQVAPGADPFAAGTRGARVRTLTDALNNVVIAKDSSVFGQASVFLEGRRNAVRTQETNLGNLTADANLAAAQTVDPSVVVSIKNGGGIRAEIGAVVGDTGLLLPTAENSLSGKQAGQISQLDIENSLRFNNGLSMLTVSAAELKMILEHGVAASSFGATPGQFPQVGGLRFSFDPNRASIRFAGDGTVQRQGERIRNLAIVNDAGDVLDVVVQDGQVVGDPSREIRLVTLNFLADGGDGYPFRAFGESRVDLQADGAILGEQQALADYLANRHADEPYAEPDTPIYLDSRIQNLAARGDAVLTPLSLEFSPIGTYATGLFDLGGAEIAAYDPQTQRVFFTEAESAIVGILDIRIPQQPIRVGTIDLTPYGSGPTSVTVANGVVAIAVTGFDDADNGSVVLFDVDGNYLNSVTVGNLPDMLTFTPDGSTIVVANEGEPLEIDFEDVVAARFATFNASLNRASEGQLIDDLSSGEDQQARNVAEIIQRTQPDVLLLNEFDYDANGLAVQLFRQNYLQVSQNGQKPAFFPHVYLAPSNTGVLSEFDFNNDGTFGGPNDAYGFGTFPGQFGMVLLSRYPILTDQVRTFQNFLWKDMPGALLPDDPSTPEPADWYSAEELEVFRLSSKSHWDVPIDINGTVLHVLASHPTPPVFDGPEDFNGRRNHDEIRFWSDYVTPGAGAYIRDDNGQRGGVDPNARFVIMGDLNADPRDGDSLSNAALQLLLNPMINSGHVPASEGGMEAAERQGGINQTHAAPASHDTADFAEENFGGPGNLRVDYVLPSTNLSIVNSGVYWPTMESPEFGLTTDFPPSSSDHRLVYSDLQSEGIDPPGGVSIIDLSRGPAAAQVTNIDFRSLLGREDELRAKGVRIFPGNSAWHDLEPEYISVSPDGRMAMVTLQEANSLAVIDLQAKTLLDVVPLGTKDHFLGNASVELFPVADLPDLEGQTPAGQTIKLGGFSGLFYVGDNPDNGNPRFVTIPDRGPNPETGTWDVDGDGVTETVRPFALPDYQARIVTLEVDLASGQTHVVDQMMLTRPDQNDMTMSLPITGRPNLFRSVDGAQIDEFPVDLLGNPLELDPFGGDFEGIVLQPGSEGSEPSYWMVDEYRPAIYHFRADGVLINRFIPQGTAALAGQPEGTYGTETLPAEYVTRRANRGFEAVALDPESGILYAFIQTPLANPNRAASNNSDVIRILGIDTATGEVIAEYVYLLEDLATSVVPGGRVDKIGDAVWAGDGKLFVLERDSGVGSDARKPVFQIDLTHATNLRAADAPSLYAGKSLERHTANELASLAIRPVIKTKITNLPSIGYVAGDKPEGLSLLPDGSLVVLNDNDFSLAVDPVFDDAGQSVTGGGAVFQATHAPEVLGIIRFDRLSGFDASNLDGRIAIQPQPVRGLYMPDAIASFQVGGQTYYVTANEGDSRDEVVRGAAAILDETAFPNAAELQSPERLGRLNLSSIDGDWDGDGDLDQLFSYGARSFSIWDATGNLVFDSGMQLEMITANFAPTFFNADNTESTFDSRSDDKGPEPEAVTVGVVGANVYAFVGLERVGGIAVYDVTDPVQPHFVQYINNRDFVADQESAGAQDQGVESIVFIPAAQSPIGKPLLVAANEVSGTVTLYAIESTGVAGDFDRDGRVTAVDLETLGQGIGSGDARYDANQDGRVNQNDHRYFLANQFPAVIGDSNLDGRFDSADLVAAVASGEYEDGVKGNSGWSEGDWDGDGEFTSRDLILAFQIGHYVAAAGPTERVIEHTQHRLRDLLFARGLDRELDEQPEGSHQDDWLRQADWNDLGGVWEA